MTLGGNLIPAAVAIPAVLGAVGIGGSIFSGITGANAAKSAAQVQADAAAKAGQQVTDSAAAVNPGITSAAATAGAGATRAAGDAGAGVASATDRANGLLDPYRLSGEAANSTLENGLVAGGDFNRMPTAADVQLDPAFADRLAAGAKVLDRSAAARGGANSGTQAMALNDYAQTNASSEYEKAFERYRTSTQDRFNNLNTVAGRGADVSNTEGKNLINSGVYSGDAIQKAATYQGDKTYGAAVDTGNRTFDASRLSADYLTQKANAEAGGIVGKSNAITGAIGGGINALTGAASLYARMSDGGGGGIKTNAPYYDPNGTTTNPDGSLTVRRNPGIKSAASNPGLLYVNNLRKAA